MAATPIATKDLDGYGSPEIPWERVQAVLAGDIPQVPGEGGPNRHTTWLATTDPDGRPHVMPVGMIVVDGTCTFTSSLDARKGRNLLRDPRCTLTVATLPMDLVIEGEATVVRDAATLERIAAEYASGGWPAVARDGALWAEFSAPSAGPPPWHVFAVRITKIFALGAAEPYGATKFEF
jgi:hypothetical protein